MEWAQVIRESLKLSQEDAGPYRQILEKMASVQKILVDELMRSIKALEQLA